MRKINNILARIIVVIFLLHAFMGSLLLLELSSVSLHNLSKILFIMVIIHGVLGLIATIASVKSGAVSGHWYLKQNAAFWTKRISGVVIMLLLVFHITAFTTSVNGRFFLKEFTLCSMLLHIIFILSIFIHLAVSIKPMLIAKGVLKYKERTFDWMLVLSVMTLVFMLSVIAYFIKWQM